MEYINKVQLRGIVGLVRQTAIGQDKVSLNLSLMTEYTYKDPQGMNLCEVQWHNVRAVVCSDDETVSKIKKGSVVEAEGRLRRVRYTSAEGSDQSYVEIYAQKLRFIGEAANILKES